MTESEKILIRKTYEIVLRLEQWKDDQEKSMNQFWEKDWKELKYVLKNHDKRIGKIEKWQAMSIGVAITCSTILALIIKIVNL
jgi:hypothetical protein